MKRSEILKFPEVRIVEASAGSGKTRALARRYVQLLLHPALRAQGEPLRTILAITFANKAAFEMKERILLFLRQIALDKFRTEKERKDLLESLAVNEKKAGETAYAAMENAIRNYNFFQVQTIDSLINTILRASAFNRPDASATFKIKEDPADYLAYSLDELIDRASGDKGLLKVFHNFLRQYIYVENKQGWLPKEGMLSILNALLSETDTYGAPVKKYGTKTADILSIKQKVLRLVRELAENLPEGTDKTFAKKLASFVEENERGFRTAELPERFKNEGFPVNKGYEKEVSAKTRNLWKSIKKEIKELCEAEAFSSLDCYVDIFDEALHGFTALSNKEEVIFLGELNRQARALFDKESITVPELYYRLATSFRHLLIDEFQDTSALQWQNISGLADEAISTGGTLFCVGDKKQAIYRFRGGNTSLMGEVEEAYKKVQPVVEYLNCNYRSQKEVVEFNNLVFSAENLKTFIEKAGKTEFGASDIRDILGVFEKSQQSYEWENRHGYVRIEPVDAKNKDERNDAVKEKLLGLIKELDGRFSKKDIAILTRKNEDAELLTGWLLEGNIPVESDKTLNIKENGRIKEMISLLKFLDFPPDNLSFASFILGEIFLEASGIDEETMRSFVARLGKEQRGGSSVPFYQKFREEFPDAWESLLDEFYGKVGFMPLYELAVSIAEKLGVMKNFPEGQGFFMRFLELIKKYEEETTSVSSFLEYFDEAREQDLYVNVSATHAVKVLTIHKAKGLEFPVVIIPFLEMDVNVGSGARGSNSYIVRQERDGLHLLRLLKFHTDFSPKLKELYRQEYKKSFIDELNAIYVALTRAKYELYAFVPAKSANAPNPARLLVPFETEKIERGEMLKYEEEEKKQEHLLKEIPPSEHRDWIGLLKDEFADEEIIRNRKKVLRGKAAHHILSFIGNLRGLDKGRAVKDAVAKARPAFPAIEDFSEFEQTIRKLLDEERFRDFFFIDDGEVYQEKEIVNSFGDTKRIDRLVVKKDKVIIVDYKSSREDKEEIYRKQLSEYIGIIRDVYPGAAVKGFLIYLDDLSADEVDG